MSCGEKERGPEKMRLLRGKSEKRWGEKYIHILEGLLTEEVVEYKRQDYLKRIFDPSPNMVQIVIILLSRFGQ